MSRKVEAAASAIVRRMRTRSVRRRGRVPFMAAVASAVARRLAAPAGGPRGSVGVASPVAARLVASPRQAGPKRVLASTIARSLSVPSRRRRRKWLAAAVASAVARRLARPGRRR
jgi:hypothetical protein